MMVCGVGAFALLCYALFARLWAQNTRGWTALGLAAAGVAGTALVLAIPAFRTPAVGMVWTFALLCLLSATFYLNLRERLGAVQTAVLLSMRLVAIALLVPML